MPARSLVRIAIEWCGIIDSMKVTSPISVWLRLITSSAAASAAAPTRAPSLRPGPSYIRHMKPSITTAITQPMASEATSRFTLKSASSSS